MGACRNWCGLNFIDGILTADLQKHYGQTTKLKAIDMVKSDFFEMFDRNMTAEQEKRLSKGEAVSVTEDDGITYTWLLVSVDMPRAKRK